MKHWLVLYDIANGRRLARTAKIIESYGVRVQKSVFEIYASEEVVFEMRQKIRKIIDEDEDFVIYFDICERDWQKQIKIGVGKNIKPNDNTFEIL